MQKFEASYNVRQQNPSTALAQPTVPVNQGQVFIATISQGQQARMGNQASSQGEYMNVESADVPAARPVTPREMQCVVCGAESSGFHHGVRSCDGCKSYSNRYLTNPEKEQKFRCLHSGSCVVDAVSRIKCRPCRLKKCLKVGMRRIGKFS